MDIVSRVRRASVALRANEIVAKVTDTAPILIYLVLTTDWGHAVWDAFGSCHVVPKDAHTLAQDVIIGLQIGAVNLSWLGSFGLREIGIGESILYLGDF